jgi:predicted outer membrane repeat protein
LKGQYLPDFSGLSPTPTVIKPGGLLPNTSVMRITNGVVRLENLHITGGWFSLAQSGYGAGVYIYRAEAVFIDSCEIYGNTAKGLGGGIYCDNSRLEMRESLVHDNRALKTSSIFSTGGIGGGIYVRNGIFMLQDSTVYANTAVADGGAIGLSDATNVLSGGVMIGTIGQAPNSADTRDGGGIYALRSRLIISNGVSIVHNRAARHGGGMYVEAGSLVLDDAVIGSHMGTLTNWAGTYGGGLYLHSTTCAVDNVDIINNQAGEYGGGVYAGNASRIEVTRLSGPFTVLSNRAERGAGIYVQDQNTSFSITGGTWPGAIRDNYAYFMGGGMYACSGAYVSLEKNTTVSGNTAYINGGGMLAVNRDTIIRLSGVTVSGNSAYGSNPSDDLGGGGGVIGYGAFLECNNCLFDGNYSSVHGGALAIYGKGGLDVSSAYTEIPPDNMPATRFVNNSSGMNGQGGAILVADKSCARIDSALFSGNTSMGYGGALYIYSDSTCTVINTIIAGNDSNQEGDGLRAAGDSQVQLLHCTVVSNNEEGVTALESSGLNLTNCIVWGHSVLEITTNKTVYSCDVDGGYPGGAAVMDSNPQFVDPAAMDFRLLVSSPCLHAGIVTYLGWDCIGDSRGIGESPTLGAYETGVPEPGMAGWLAVLACCLYRARRRS